MAEYKVVVHVYLQCQEAYNDARQGIEKNICIFYTLPVQGFEVIENNSNLISYIRKR